MLTVFTLHFFHPFIYFDLVSLSCSLVHSHSLLLFVLSLSSLPLSPSITLVLSFLVSLSLMSFLSQSLSSRSLFHIISCLILFLISLSSLSPVCLIPLPVILSLSVILSCVLSHSLSCSLSSISISPYSLSSFSL